MMRVSPHISCASCLGHFALLWNCWTSFQASAALLQSRPFYPDAAFLLTVGSFLLTVELFYLQLTFLAFLLTILVFLLTALAFYLQLELFCLQWESASKKRLKGL